MNRSILFRRLASVVTLLFVVVLFVSLAGQTLVSASNQVLRSTHTSLASTQGWKIFSDPVFVYRLQYPPQATTTRYETSRDLQIIVAEGISPFTVETLQNPNGLNAEMWVKQNLGVQTLAISKNLQKIRVGNQDGYAYTLFAGDHTRQYVVVAQAAIIHRISFALGPNANDPNAMYHEQEFWQILSTFQVGNVTPAVEANTVVAAPHISLAGEIPPLTVPLFKQADSRWGGIRLGVCNGLTIRTAGCAITSLAMIFNYYQPDFTDPGRLDNCLTNNNGYVSGCSVIWGNGCMPAGVSSAGWGSTTQIDNELLNGHPVVARLILDSSYGAYAGADHFVVITGKRSDGQYIMNDPGFDRTILNPNIIQDIQRYNGTPPVPNQPHNPAPNGNFSLNSLQVGHLEIFRRDPSGAANHRWWDGGASWFGAWDSLGININGTPSVVSWGPDRQDVFVHASDGSIYHQIWTRSGGRGPWIPMNGTTNDDMTVFSLQPGHLEVLVNGGGILYQNWSNDSGATWSGWQGLGLYILGTPTVITTGPDRQDLFVHGSDNVIYHQTWTRSGGRTTWTPMGTTYDDIAVISPQPGDLVVFVRGTDGYLYHSWSTDTGTTWSGWVGLGIKLIGKPSVVSWGPDRSDVFVRGEDDVMYHLTYTSSVGWGSWESLGGQTKFAPQAISWGNGRLDVFHIGLDGNFYHKWWTGSLQSAWYQVGTYQYVPPQIILAPLQLTRGTQMSENGSGFTPNGQLHMSILLPDGTYYEQALQADANGSFANPYTMPTTAGIGHYAYRIQDLTTGVWSNTVEYDVLALTPTVSVTPGSGPIGTMFNQPGAGFTPNGQVSLEFTYPDGSLHTSIVTANASGSYTNDYTMPSTALLGTYSYHALDVTSNTWSTTVTFVVEAPATYSVSGYVTDSSNVGLAGVTITDGTRNAATDSSGNYTLSGVPSGSYTLTPSLNGYSFSPASLSVSVSGNVTGQNFTGTPTAIATPLPTAMPSPTATPLPPTATPSPTATATPPTGTAVLALVPTTTAFAVGDTFIVGVEVQSGAQSVDGAAVYLDFDPAVLEVLSVIPSSSLPITLTQQLDPIGGHLDLVRGAISPLPQGTFALATITFRARSAAPGGTLLGLSRTAARQSDVTFNGSSVLGQTVPVTITVNDGLALTVEVQFQGLPLAPSSRLSVPLSVTLTLVGATTPVYQSTLATDQYGRFSITGVAPGTYTLSVKHAQSLRVQTTAVVSAGATTLSVGPLPSGDSNDDNRINVLDFSLLASTFGKSSSTTGYDGRADFNSDGIINLLDFSLLATNFGKAGLASATPALTTASSSQVIAQVVRDLTVGETFTLDLAVNAPTTGIDGAAAYLNFDPTLLDVVNIAVDPTLDLTLQQEVNTTSGQVALVRGTLRSPLPTGRVKLATITFRARMQAAAAISLVDDGALRQSAVTASGRVLTLAEAPWQLTAGSAGHSVYLPLVVR